jgi:hypothetical protein
VSSAKRWPSSSPLLRAGLCALVLLGAACGQAPSEQVEGSQQRVIFGQLSGPEDDGVVQLWANEGTVINKCTGSLIAENLILTARHCVAHGTEGTFSCTSSGELTPGSTGAQVGAPLEPSSISVYTGAHPGKAPVATAVQIFAAQATTVCRNDIAVVLLDRPLSGFPILPLRLLSGVQPGERVRLVGYGEDEANGFGVRKTLSDLVISMVGASNFRPKGDDVPARTFVTDGPSGCQGDSGGPTLSARGAAIGVFSQVAGTCAASTARDFFTEVGPFNDELLKPAFAAAHAEPVLEPTGDAGATGAAGAAGAEAFADAGASAAGSPTLQPSGDAGAEDAPEYHLPRNAGGCKCRMTGGAGAGSEREPLLAALVVVLWRARSRRRRHP